MRVLPTSRVAALAALALAAAACGGDRLSRPEYETRVAELGDRFAGALQEVVSSPQLQDPDSLGEAAGKVRQGQQAFVEVSEALEGLEPPEDAQAAHDRLVAGIRELASDLGRFAAAAEAGDLEELAGLSRAFQERSLPSFEAIAGAVEELERLGYHLQGGS